MPPELAWIEHFHFLRPAWALLLLPWLAMAWIRHRQKSQRELFGGIIAPHLLDHLRVHRFDSRWFNPQSVSAVLVLLVIILLMGPSWRQQASPLSEDDSALVIILDVSTSMLQKDIQPSRLERAKQKVSDLLALRPDKKAAIVAFSGSAHTMLPLTGDHSILRQYLSSVDPDMMPRSGKFPEYALPLVDDILRDTTAPATVLLIGDGTGADTEKAFREWFSERPHRLLVLGIGSTERTSESARNFIPLDYAALNAIVDTASGTYLSLSIDNSDMKKANRYISSHYVIVEDSALPWLDSGYWLVFPAMAIFLLWFRKGWTLTWSWLVIPFLLASPSPQVYAQDEPEDSNVPVAESSLNLGQKFVELWLTPDQQGRLLMARGKYPEAAARFAHPAWKATAFYFAEEFMLAAEYYSRSDTEDALFNEANARAHARDYIRALSRYDRLLARNASYPGAAENRQRVQELVDEIERLSASQQQESGVSGEEKTLDSDDAIPAMGADELSWEKAELKQFTAEEILQDTATQDMWLRSVQQDPSNFLAIKFSMQLNQAAKDSGEGQ
jgi:Ca-activated chloride channel family protein